MTKNMWRCKYTTTTLNNREDVGDANILNTKYSDPHKL